MIIIRLWARNSLEIKTRVITTHTVKVVEREGGRCSCLRSSSRPKTASFRSASRRSPPQRRWSLPHPTLALLQRSPSAQVLLGLRESVRWDWTRRVRLSHHRVNKKLEFSEEAVNCEGHAGVFWCACFCFAYSYQILVKGIFNVLLIFYKRYF